MAHPEADVAQAIVAIDEIEDDPRNTRTMVEMILDYKQRSPSNTVDKARITALDMRESTLTRERALQTLIDIAEETI